MKTRLIAGIISMLLALVIIVQLFANSLKTGSEETSGFAGFLLSVCFLIAGAVGVATRKKGVGGAITSIIFYVIGGFIGIFNYGTFAGSHIWGVLGFIFALLHLLSIIIKPKKNLENYE